MIKISRSRAIVLAAAGALSVATAASTALTSWSASHAGSGETANRLTSAADATSPLRLNFVAYQQRTVVAAPRTHEVRLAGTRLPVLARPQAATRRVARKSPVAAKATASPAPTASPGGSASAGSGSPQQIAQGLLSSFGWPSSQFACLNPLWQHESGWSVSASNAGSGAYGIPQALPGSRMASAGPDWQTNATTQIKWGLQYIKSTYGSPCAAYAHEQSTGWY
jgi:hypothetical protein